MRIIVDAMGGDNAPGEIIKGAVQAVREYGVELTLVGIEDRVRECLSREKLGGIEDKISVVNATEIVTMEDDPTSVMRAKKDSSMSVALRLLKNGEGDACISAGSTGALLTGATLIVKRVHGIRRAALAPVVSNGKKGVMLLDCGANSECTPEYLLQFAFMGSFYAKMIMGIDSPRVALLNNGAEEHKGAELQQEVYQLLKKAGEDGHINFVGNVEGSGVLSDTADVVVADGFSGNIWLKASEGMAKFVSNNLKTLLMSTVHTKIGALLIKSKLEELKKLIDPSEVGGTPLLGITKPVIKAHGSSNAVAVKNAIRQAIGSVNAGVADEIEKNIDVMTISRDTIDK